MNKNKQSRKDSKNEQEDITKKYIYMQEVVAL